MSVTIEQLSSFCRQAMMQLGANETCAAGATDPLVMADSWGVFTHGSKLLFDYARRIQAGGIRVDQSPQIEREGPAWATVQANSVMGQIAASFAMQVAIDKARQCGIGYVNVKNTNHFGAAGFYSYQAAIQGLIGISMANDIPSVAGPGSKKAVAGSNPLSYAIPVGDGQDPILLDMATSTVAGGKVFAAFQRGEPIPDTWIVDNEGKPTTDASLYPLHAALQPMTDRKGYGIALLIETLSGVLSGAAMTWQVGSWINDDPTKPTNHGAAVMAVDIAAMMDRHLFQQRIQHIVDEIHAAPTVDGCDRMLLPGEREWKHRRFAVENGIPLPADVIAKLHSLSDFVGIRPDWLNE